MSRIDRSKLEGPKIDRRTTVKLLGMAGMGGAAALAGCSGQSDGDGGGDSGDGGGDGGDGGTDGGSTESDGGSGEASTGGSVTMGVALDALEELDPHYTHLHPQISIQANIFNGLTKLNENVEIVGDLATDWSLPDDTTYEFTLREGVTFHNGDEFTAESVKYSIERLMSLDDSPQLGKTATVDSVEAVEPTLVRINLSTPTAPFVSFTTRGPGRLGTIVNQTAVEKGADQYNRFPVGTGPFQVGDRSDGEYLELEAYDDYWETDDQGNSLPYLDSVRINLIPELSTMWTAHQSGEIDFVDELGYQFGQQAQSSNQLSVEGRSAAEWHTLALLCDDPASEEWRDIQSIASGYEEVTDHWSDKEIATKDPKVRHAIAKAIDRETLTERAYFGFARPAHTLLNPQNWAFTEDVENKQEYDPEGAKRLLDEAGYTGDPRLQMRMLGTPTEERIMTVLQEQLESVGIQVELNVLQSSSFWDEIYRFNRESTMYWGNLDIDPWMSFWKQLRTPEEGNSSGVWQKNLYSNEEFDELLTQSYNTPKKDERIEYVRQAEQIVLEDAPYAMLAYPEKVKSWRNRVSGVRTQLAQSLFHRAQVSE